MIIYTLSYTCTIIYVSLFFQLFFHEWCLSYTRQTCQPFSDWFFRLLTVWFFFFLKKNYEVKVTPGTSRITRKTHHPLSPKNKTEKSTCNLKQNNLPFLVIVNIFLTNQWEFTKHFQTFEFLTFFLVAFFRFCVL